MKRIFSILICLVSVISYSQEKGSIAGAVTDKETGDQPLPFANVTLKNTSKGTTTDFDGLYEIINIDPGTYTVVFSFVGYETLEVPEVKVVANKVTEVNTGLGASAAALDEVMITTVARRDSETALLLDQKEAIDIKESIGAQELAKLGVSDVATATTKISGVSNSEASGEVYVRGLGDRYLYTTLNGLNVPSDNVDKKNIDMGLFPTRVVQSVSVNKNFMPSSSSDQSSGSINIISKELVGTEELKFGVSSGVNTNALQPENFKRTANAENISFGFYSKDMTIQEAITQQSWNPETMKLPIDYSYDFTYGKKIGENFKILFTGSQSSDFEYNQGLFQQFDRNIDDVRFTDATFYTNNISTTGLLDLTYSLGRGSSLKAVSLFVNKMTDQVFEAGENREGFVFEEVNNRNNFSQYVRDQNTRQTRLFVNQIMGDHEIGENNNVSWGFGYNILDADEPNRIRNEVNIRKPTDNTPETILLANQGGYQNRKQYQDIDDTEYSARIKDELQIFENDTISSLKLSVGGNFRNKMRDFAADRVGVVEQGAPGQVVPPSLENLGAVFNEFNFENGPLRYERIQRDNEPLPDTYTGELNSTSGFLGVNYAIHRFNFNLGARYQKDQIDVDYDVANARGGRVGNIRKEYDNIYPAINIKYALNSKNNFRVAASRTITLPEFKEIAPFGYVSPTNQVIVGNTEIEASTVYNFDLKWELFPSNKELISVTGFYKDINDPINRTLDRGSSGYFTFFNTSDKARVYGLELDADLNLISSENGGAYNLDLGINFTRMWHNQDLKVNYNEEGRVTSTFRYNNKTEIGLEGAPDYILNASLNFSTNWKKEFNANISGNYSSDKIYALGSAPDSQTVTNSTLYNNEIVEKGFVILNATINQKLSDHIALNLKALNLLNPEIERTQDIYDFSTETEREETIRSYKNGVSLSLGFNYTF